MKQTEKMYKAQCDAIVNKSPLDMANSQIASLNTKLERREDMIIELKRCLNSEIAILKYASAEEVRARVNMRRSSEENANLAQIDEIADLKKTLKERDEEVQRLKMRLEKDTQRIKQSVKEIQHMEIIFREELQSLEMRLSHLKKCLVEKDEEIKVLKSDAALLNSIIERKNEESETNIAEKDELILQMKVSRFIHDESI